MGEQNRIDKKILKFPEDFYWGASTSAYQIEGGNVNDWSEWERRNAERLAKEAKDYYQKWQQEKFPEMFDPKNYISGRACDHYNRFKEDFDIAKQLGHNAHRFSIEWSRIEPEEGRFNEKEIGHYREVIKTLRERGIEPFVTLWHWTNPIWISEIGGWGNKKTTKYFLRYAEKLANKLGNEVKFWIPFNEPQTYIGLSYVIGKFPPQVRNLYRANKVFKNIVLAHKETYKLFHQISKNRVRVGASHYIVYHTAYSNNVINLLVVKLLTYIRGYRFVKAMNKYQDFIGLQYYHHDRIRLSLGGKFIIAKADNENKAVSDLGWEIYPEGIYHILKNLKKFNLPIYITENGLADAQDAQREKFIKDHLYWVHKAIQEGIDVRGYFYWSLLDNFEWAKGFWPRFGLVEMDYKTLKRKIRPSARAYGEICRNNSLIIK
jgi:beta-glucosidase